MPSLHGRKDLGTVFSGERVWGREKRCRKFSGLLLRKRGTQRHMPPFSLERKLQQAGRLNCLLATQKVQDQEREPCPLHYGWVWRRIGAPLGSRAPDPLMAAAVKLCHSAEGHSKLRDTVSIQHATEQVKGRLGPSLEQAHSQPLARKCRTL